MIGPQLQAKDPSNERGFAPPRLKRWLSLLPKDMQTIVDWVIQNFIAISQTPPTTTGGTITVTDGTTTIVNVTTIRFDGALFTVSDGGGGTADVTLQTESCP